MFRRYGCGCIYLITKIDASNTPTHGRLIDYCGGNSDSLTIGGEVEIRQHVNLENILAACDLDSIDSDALFNRLNDKIAKGYRFEMAQRFLRGMLNG